MKIFLSSLCFLLLMSAQARAQEKSAIFAGGCFWCMESEFESAKGVSDVTSGYAGGDGPAPTYEEVSRGDSGFIEAVKVTYDPAVVSYERLLDIFWSNVDPFDDKGQFCDKGAQYAAAIFTGDDHEKTLAEKSLKQVEEKYGRDVATRILPRGSFYAAEDHHQDYYKKNAVRYKLYKSGCGRDARLKELKRSAE